MHCKSKALLKIDTEVLRNLQLSLSWILPSNGNIIGAGRLFDVYGKSIQYPNYAIYVARLEAPRYSRRSLNMNQLGEVLDCSLKIG